MRTYNVDEIDTCGTYTPQGYAKNFKGYVRNLKEYDLFSLFKNYTKIFGENVLNNKMPSQLTRGY